MVCEESALNYTGLTLEKLEKEGMDGETLYKELCVIFKDFKRGKKLPLLCGHNVDEFDKAFLEISLKNEGRDGLGYLIMDWEIHGLESVIHELKEYNADFDLFKAGIVTGKQFPQHDIVTGKQFPSVSQSR